MPTIVLTSGTSWTVPSDWNDGSNTIEVIGGGGAGAAPGGQGEGGGGGGAYSKAVNVSLTPGATVSIAIGAGGASAGAVGGDTYLCSSSSGCASIAGASVVCGAKGGSGGSGGSGGAGGGSGSGIGATRYSGGNGGDASTFGNNAGAGGGGAAGPNGAGANGGTNTTSYDSSGGGGSGGGSAGSNAIGGPGAGGNNFSGSGGGSAPAGDGSDGGGGGGGSNGSGTGGGDGGAGVDFADGSYGAGGGGGGGGYNHNGGAGGLYGGGGGGSGYAAGSVGLGAQGIIYITYTVSGPTTQTLHPSVIPTGEHWGSPTVTGGLLAIIPAEPAINTGERWYTPDVAGPINPTKIPSGEHWPTPGVDLFQKIAPATIPSGEHWFTPAVAIVQQITLAAAIPTSESWNSPVVESGVQFVNTRPIPSGESWPTPGVTGGRGGFQLFLGGIDYTAYMNVSGGTASQITSQTLGRWQMTFELADRNGTLYQNSIASPAVSPPAPLVGMTVLVIDNGLRIFAGCIQSIVDDRVINQPYAALYQITATDKSAICDHRVVTGTTYPSGSDAAQTILAIVASYLNGEGIGTSQIPTDGSLGTLSADLVCNFITVTNAFDSLASQCGLVWWIDSYCMLNFSPLNTLPSAPFDLTETSDNYRASQNGQTNSRGGRLTVTKTTVDYYNKLYAVSNLNVVPGSQSGAGAGNTETYTWAFGANGIVPGYLGAPLAGCLLQVSAGIGSVTSMTVNGAPQTVVDYSMYSGQTSTGPTDYLWFFQQGTNLLAPTYGGSIPNGAVIVIEYVPYSSTGASVAQYGEALVPVTPDGTQFQTCGSGIYEGVIQVQNLNSQAQLNNVAAAELARIGGIPTMVDFETDQGGLFPGMLLTVDIPISGVQGQLLITQMIGTMQAGPLLTGFRFRWDVRATSILDPGNWITWYERLVGRTNNPLPVPQYEQALFLLGGGGNISVGNNVTNPYPVRRTGQLVTIQYAASAPPTGQNLVLQITDNGNVIAQVTLPQTATANQLFVVSIPQSAQQYVYAQDVLNVNAMYQVTGGSPTPAQGVTLQLSWTM